MKPFALILGLLIIGTTPNAIAQTSISAAVQDSQQSNYEKQEERKIVKLINNYYAAINKRHYRTAFNQWHLDDKNVNFKGQNYTKFVAGFANTKYSKVTVTNIEPLDAGMSKLVTNVHVTIKATNKNGTKTNFSGYYFVSRTMLPESDHGWKIIDAKITKVK